MEKTKINYFKEKCWIMAWWYKQRNELHFSQADMLFQWNTWWKHDFIDIDNLKFQKAYRFVIDTVNSMSMEQIKKGRYDVAVNRKKPVPNKIQQLALSKGYFVKKAAIARRPLTVDGYAIFKKGKKNKKPVYGDKFELTIRQVKEFLEGCE